MAMPQILTKLNLNRLIVREVWPRTSPAVIAVLKDSQLVRPLKLTLFKQRSRKKPERGRDRSASRMAPAGAPLSPIASTKLSAKW